VFRQALSFILLLGVSSSALGKTRARRFEWPELKGHVYVNVYQPFLNPDNQGTDLRQFAIGGWLGADPKVSTHISSHFMFTGDHLFHSTIITSDGTVSDGTNIFKVREANVQYRNEGWDVRAGQLIIPWGVSDGFNPTDFLSASDSRVFTPIGEEKRVSHLSGAVTYTPNGGESNLSVTAVVTAIFPRSNLLIAPTSIPSFVKIAGEHYSSKMQNPEIAGRISYLGSGWDLDLIGFLGYDHNPYFREDSRSFDFFGPHLVVSPTYDQISSVGSNFTMTKGAWIFRTEAGYSVPYGLPDLLPLDDTEHVDGVIGLERPVGESFRVQLQGITTYFPFYRVYQDADSVSQQLRTANGIIHGMTERTRLGSSFRLSFENADLTAFTAEIAAVAYFGTNFEYFLRPLIGYKFTQGLKFSLGLEDAGGPVSSPLGSLKSFNSVFADLRCIF
jgi:hypothetical protein